MKKHLGLLAVILLVFAGCRQPTSENDKAPVNTPRPNPIVEKTNEVGVPITNVPVTTSKTNR